MKYAERMNVSFIYTLKTERSEYVSGESQYTWVQDGYTCKCIFFTGNPIYPILPINYSGSSGTFCTDNTNVPLICTPPQARWKLQQVQKPGDVIVLSESAKNFPGAQHKIRIEHTNHQKLKNATRTGEKLNNLYDGKYDVYFSTAKR